MILCHCHGLTDADVRGATEAILREDPQAVITVSRLFRALGRAPDCSGCVPLMLAAARGAKPRAGSRVRRASRR